MNAVERRTFLVTAGAATAALATRTVQAQEASRKDAGGKIVLGLIGPGGMGSNHLRELASRKDVQVAHVCDVDANRLATAVKEVESRSGKAPQAGKDLRRMLDDKSVDAVFIATPDHWHAPAAILALDAGKHVYVEKPCCHNIREGRLMSDAVKRSGKHAASGHAEPEWPGDPRGHRSDSSRRDRRGAGSQGLEQPAARVDRQVAAVRASFASRLRPVDRPRSAGSLSVEHAAGCLAVVARVRLRRHWQRWGARYRRCRVGIGSDGTSEHGQLSRREILLRRRSAISRHPVFDLRVSRWKAPRDAKKQLIFEQRIWSPYRQEDYENGAAFYGTKGMLMLGHTVGWRLYGEKNKLIAEKSGGADLVAHHTNFFDCIRGQQKQLNADVKAGHIAATIVHLSNIAARLGRTLQFDPIAETVANDDQANALVRRTYRDSHWATPKGV